MNLRAELSNHLRSSRVEIVERWLERISDRVAVTPGRIFPTDELLNHVPLLIDGIADYLGDEDNEFGAELPVSAKAMELGALRHAQGFDAYEILKEYEILSGIIFTRFASIIDGLTPPRSASSLTDSWQRVSHAIELIRQATVTHFLRLSAERVNEREERLRRFNRMVSHELKNRVGALQGAAKMLGEPWLDGEERERFHQMIATNADGLLRVLRDLESLSRIDSDSRQRRNVLLPDVAQEVVRQLRDVATARGVTVEIDPALPAVEVDAAAVELCLTNYVSNALKYSDPAKAERWVTITAQLRSDSDAGGELAVCVRDNGLGVPRNARQRLFEQFYRADHGTVTGAEGSGLGLSIVRDTVASLGGNAWADFPGVGSAFYFSLPSRRAEDASAAGTHRPAQSES